eukprot:Blabericola_migrator_1__612@NODE_1150_length_5271_cov_66_799577_g784_i0_p2_GENE_NODE_1150_length_5271_cov_66_799577_g784_i0NODE_1150_length_5271_cov_66_799577_g784_i0_p2_ORF_typecomplete_len274_score33_67_NODE_1150_length_5271_cov_66_799577_g784_i035894410
MSARHLQRLEQINLRDGRVGIALLVTLAMNQPAGAEALGNQSHIPSDSYTGPSKPVSTPSLSLLNSEDMLRPDYKPSVADWRRWVALRVGCLMQICQARVVEKKHTPLRRRMLGELYTPLELNELGEREDSGMYVISPEQYNAFQDILIDAVGRLLNAQQGPQRKQWHEYERQHQLQKSCQGTHGSTHTYLHAAQWLFENATPEFFAEHRSKFVGVSEILVDWTTKIIQEVNTSKVPRGLPYITDVINDGKLHEWVLASSEQLDDYIRRRHKQ